MRKALFLLCVALPLSAQVPTIIEEMGKLESVRDPKCYATASRLEDFIYGTPLDTEARFEKVTLQKAFIRDAWDRAAAEAEKEGKSTIDAATLSGVLQSLLPHTMNADSSWYVRGVPISARDKRQYGTIAYALRALLAVQQDALLGITPPLLPLEPQAVETFKDAIDLATLAALQRADLAARRADREFLGADLLVAAWTDIVAVPEAPPAAAASADVPEGERFATIKAIIAEKLAAFEAYNKLSMPVFLRNLQVYMARHLWPDDPEEGRIFRDQFTTAMITWTGDVLLEAEKHAKERKDRLVRVEDVHEALQRFQPHEANQYEDIIYFPRFPREERIIIEAYDLDSFRDPGIHWLYLEQALNNPGFKGTIEPDPFAAELLVEGAAQFGVLVLRVAGQIAEEEGVERLDPSHLTKSLVRIQALLDRHAKLPEQTVEASAIPSAPEATAQADGKFFTDVTDASGIAFEHRLSDWLARFIRSYTVTENGVVRLAVPPTFGGSGAAAEDIDGDGDIDVLLLGGAGNRLFLNDGTGRFTDGTARSGLDWRRPDGRAGEPRQPLVADFDNDGLEDIIITYVNDAHRVYRNVGDGTFEDVTATAKLGGKGEVAGPATALDFDRDGLLDLYVGMFGNYIDGDLPTLARRNDNAMPDKLFRNRGGFVFEDVTEGSGVANKGWAQSVGHLDFDGDGWEDLICGNDFGTNAWYRNRGDGTFEDVSAKLGTDKPSYTMNLGITDLNRDGYPDVYVSNIVTMDKDEKYVLPDPKTRLKFNPAKMANMRVVEANDLWMSSAAKGKLAGYEQSDSVGRGLRSTGWAWDADFFDYDNDGDDDLYVVNGMNEYAVYSSVNPYLTDPSGKPSGAVLPVAEKEVPVFFVNREGKLQEETAQSGAAPAGNARSVVYFDADADGDLDMVVNNFNSTAIVYRNNADANSNNWLALRLIGDLKKGVTRDAIGARILVDTDSQKGIWREVFSTIGYLSVHPKEQHVGLGKAQSAEVTVIWPNGDRETFRDVEANKRYTIMQGEGIR